MDTKKQLPPLSTEAFESAVSAYATGVAVFDCDGTLWSGDAGSAFMNWTINTGLISAEAVAWINERYRLYTAGEVSELAICGEMVQVYLGLRVGDMRSAAAEFFAEHIEPNIFPEMQRVVARLQHDNADIWAVSSTCDWVIEEGVRRFGIPRSRVLAARVEVEDGIVSDRLLEVPTDSGKVAALAAAGVTHPDAVFGNSIHDAAMLGIARYAFPVNPTPALLQQSVLEGWPVYYPELVRQP